MEALTEDEMWARVQGLTGQSVATFDQPRPDFVMQVTNEEVIIKKRVSKPYKGEIIANYKYLLDNGRITKEDMPHIPGALPHHRVGSVILAILRDVVPEQIQEIRRSEGHQLSGICLKAI
ncbi:hypothetical protein ACFLU8_04370 [Chloroflexota bacterium]